MSSVEMWFTSDESDEDEREELKVLARKRVSLRDKSNPLELPCLTFRQYFRISKELFVFLLEILQRNMKETVRSTSVRPIIKLAAVLRFFAEGSYQKGSGNDFNVGLSQPTMSKVLGEVLNIFERELCPLVIKFPSTSEEMDAIKLEFFSKFGIPGVVGCVDGTHVKIFTPSQELQHLYYNRKGFHSLNVMIVCDHKMRITYVDANNPGSCHDSFIWNSSELDENLMENFERGQRSTWLLGDAGYPLKPYLMTPFRSNSITQGQWNREVLFNTTHRAARCIVERTIGVLKSTYRCLLGARSLHYSPSKATQIINICCALHNLRINYNMDDFVDSVEIEDDFTHDHEPILEEADDSARRIRNELVNSIS